MMIQNNVIGHGYPGMKLSLLFFGICKEEWLMKIENM